MDKPGGNSWINGGQVATAGSALQRKQGIIDTPELMFSDMMKAGMQLNSSKLAMTVARESPELTTDFKTTNHQGATSEGLIAALRVDALPIQLDQIQLLPLTSPDDEGFGSANGFIAGAGMPLGILIDSATAQRFVSELADRKIQSDAIIACGHPAISITDAPAAAFSLWGLARSLKSGSVRQFDTLDALATHFGINDAFNGYVTAKSDPQFGKHILKNAKPITEAPFHAARVWPKVHYITGGVHGACRLGGSSIIDCLVFGRIAGKAVVAGTTVQNLAAGEWVISTRERLNL